MWQNLNPYGSDRDFKHRVSAKFHFDISVAANSAWLTPADAFLM